MCSCPRPSPGSCSRRSARPAPPLGRGAADESARPASWRTTGQKRASRDEHSRPASPPVTWPPPTSPPTMPSGTTGGPSSCGMRWKSPTVRPDARSSSSAAAPPRSPTARGTAMSPSTSSMRRGGRSTPPTTRRRRACWRSAVRGTCSDWVAAQEADRAYTEAVELLPDDARPGGAGRGARRNGAGGRAAARRRRRAGRRAGGDGCRRDRPAGPGPCPLHAGEGAACVAQEWGGAEREFVAAVASAEEHLEPVTGAVALADLCELLAPTADWPRRSPSPSIPPPGCGPLDGSTRTPRSSMGWRRAWSCGGATWRRPRGRSPRR